MFKFKGISSDDMKIIVEEEDNFIAKSSMKYEKIDIEGKDGSIYNALGYSDIERSIRIYVRDISKIDSILSWLNGEGLLEYKGRKTKAFFYNTIEPIRESAIKTIELSFIRSPFWYKLDDNYITTNNSIYNYGNIYALPLIKLEKKTSDEVELSINDVRFKYTFDEDTFVEIDCEKMNAFSNGILKNRNLEIGFEFPKIHPGNNKLTIHSGDATIKVKRKDRYL